MGLAEPLDMDDAREAMKVLAVRRREARENLEQAYKKAAETERDYRTALAVAHARNAGEGTAAQREAQARADVADKSYERDLAAGMVKAAHARLDELDGERASLHRVVEWSLRLDPHAAEIRGGNQRPIGARA